MILAVDDDFLILEHVRTTLDKGGWKVMTFDDPQDALSWAKEHSPELVISDVRMPSMDGFEFRDAFQQIRPDEMTPFIFMSSMSDDETVVQGLDSGADDYLIKPVSGPVLIAKVRSILRKSQTVHRMYQGDLGNLSLAHVMRFCESKGLTGYVAVEHEGRTDRVEFTGGQLAENAASKLEDLLLLSEGHFTICSLPVDLSDVPQSTDDVQMPKPVRAFASQQREDDMSEPMGLLSQVRAGTRRFQIQTEIAHHPFRAVVTLVTVDGRSVSKRSTAAPEQMSRQVLEEVVNHQHEEVEQDLKSRIEAAANKPKPSEAPPQSQVKVPPPSQVKIPPPPAEPAASPDVQFDRLFDEGFELARDGKLEEAIEIWERAAEINPFNKVLEVNLETIRKKLLKQQGKLDPFA